MRIHDTGIILNLKSFGEGKYIASVFTRTHGLVRGLIHSRRKKNIDVGYICSIQWSSRSEKSLGTLTYECLEPISSYLLTHYPRLLALQSMMELLAYALAERHPYTVLYDDTYKTLHILKSHQNSNWMNAYIRFEMTLLRELGFALSLTRCVVTQSSENLTSISPKTGCAVCEDIGQAYAPHLLPYPDCLRTHPSKNVSYHVGIHVLGFFIHKNIYSMDPHHAFPYAQARLKKKHTHPINIARKNFPLLREILCDLIEDGMFPLDIIDHAA